MNSAGNHGKFPAKRRGKGSNKGDTHMPSEVGLAGRRHWSVGHTRKQESLAGMGVATTDARTSGNIISQTGAFSPCSWLRSPPVLLLRRCPSYPPAPWAHVDGRTQLETQTRLPWSADTGHPRVLALSLAFLKPGHTSSYLDGGKRDSGNVITSMNWT